MGGWWRWIPKGRRTWWIPLQPQRSQEVLGRRASSPARRWGVPAAIPPSSATFGIAGLLRRGLWDRCCRWSWWMARLQAAALGRKLAAGALGAFSRADLILFPADFFFS